MRRQKAEGRSSEPERWRLFIAISIPAPVRDEIEQVQARLKSVLAGTEVRWTKPEQFHLTLKFLGDIEVGQLDRLISAVQAACQGVPVLCLRAQGIGAFPDLKSPRVIWAGVNDSGQFLGKLQSAIENAVDHFTAEKREGEFSGHVTLGRTRDGKTSEAETLAKLAAAMAGRSLGEWTADSVEIIRSELLPAGARYTRVAGVPLTGAR